MSSLEIPRQVLKVLDRHSKSIPLNTAKVLLAMYNSCRPVTWRIEESKNMISTYVAVPKILMKYLGCHTNRDVMSQGRNYQSVLCGKQQGFQPE